MSIEAMKLALEALEDVQEMMNTSQWFNDRVTALRKAIEQAEKQENICPRCGATLVTPYGWQSVANPTEWLDDLRGGADLCDND